MKVTLFLIFTFFILSASYNIIRDLPYDIYHIEDMSQYENNYIPEGNKYYIRFPYNIEENTKFYLTIPKEIALFPIYFSEYTTYPKDEEIINTNFKEEIELNNKEVVENIIYSFDIKKTKPYLVLYFINNEVLNYISFYADSNSNTSPILTKTNIIDLYKNVGFDIYPFLGGESYYFRINITADDKIELEIKTTATMSYYPNYEMDVKCFDYEPTDVELTNIDSSWNRNLSYELDRSGYYYEYRKYKYKTGDKVKFCGIHIYNKVTLENLNINVFFTTIFEFPTWAIVLISVIGVFFLILICRYSKRKDLENAGACLEGLCCCALCLASMANSS